MRVIVDTDKVKNLIEELLMNDYGFEEDGAEDISFDIERILIENEDD